MSTNHDYCVVCGAYVPEGRMICYKCEHDTEEKEKKYRPKGVDKEFTYRREKKRKPKHQKEIFRDEEFDD